MADQAHHGRLQGETALITGSTSGIGRAIAIRFAAEGAAVCVNGRDKTRADAVVSEITRAGGTAYSLLADLQDEQAVNDLVAHAAATLGSLTVLVNNAANGATADHAVADLTTQDWERAFRLNVTAPMWTSRAAIPAMIAAGHGSIINISSRQAERASRNFTAYVASKSALNGLTRAIAVDYAQHGIRCNTISPGFVVNDHRDATMTAADRDRREAMHLTRLGEANDIAYAAVYLASTESEYLTGTNLKLDGGSSYARAQSLG